MRLRTVVLGLIVFHEVLSQLSTMPRKACRSARVYGAPFWTFSTFSMVLPALVYISSIEAQLGAGIKGLDITVCSRYSQLLCCIAPGIQSGPVVALYHLRERGSVRAANSS